MSNGEIVYEADELQRFTEAALRALGTGAADARYIAGQIVGSELAGHESHGLRRLPEYVQRAQGGWAAPSASASVEVDRGSLVRLNGNGGFGHTVMRDATGLAIERSRAHGIAAVAVHNSEYAGRLSYFCEAAAEAGVATLLFVNDSGAGKNVAPPGGLEGRMSTNPIAAGIPRAQAPHLVLDIATSAVAMGRLSEWRDRGEDIPHDWVTPEGFLRSFGGHKGFGLALVAEALAGALTTAGTVSAVPATPAGQLQGALLIALDVEQLRPLDEFVAEVESFLCYLQDTPVAPDAAPVRVPGEGGAETAERRLAEGITLKPFTRDALRLLAEDLGLAMPTARGTADEEQST
ncbi:Ldh family oxidoreductase [Kocuria sabuli]|uniref:Ldh family oxidoreductase n=1 Tax=Kocuria sabuli TaxID=3071448 RepID=UPI0034D41253